MSDITQKPAKPSLPPDLSGQQLGDFQLLRRLGRGAMADVYLAEQCRLKRRVAVKVLKPELANDKTYLKRFEREAQAAASLVQANIVQIYEVGHVDQLHYIAQEYVEGQNLREWLARNGPPDLPHALSIIRQVAAAITKAGEQGVIHRDIKPENIMLTRSGEVKVADFGLARLAHEGTDLTQVGMTMGTPLYMSPEQVEGKPLDSRSDLYSLGVTCYHMLSGSPPFSGETALAVAVQHLKKEPERLENLRPDLPAALCRVVHKMLAKSPDERYTSARELLRELRRVQMEFCGDEWPEDLPGWDSVGLEALDDRRIQATQQLDRLMRTVAMQRVRPLRRWWLAGGILLAALAGGGAAWLLMAEPPLLTPETTEGSGIEQQSSALRQFYHASRKDTPEAWQSVKKHFPEKPSIVNRAEQQLALLYLQKGDNARAAAIFDGFTHGSDAELRAFGWAGQCVVFAEQGKYQEADQVLEDQLKAKGNDLDSAKMLRLLDRTVRTIRERLGNERAQWWDAYFKERTRGAG